MEIEEHYSQLLGIHSPWEISNVELNLPEQRVDIIIEFAGDCAPCPVCGTVSPKHDNRQETTGSDSIDLLSDIPKPCDNGFYYSKE